MTLQEYQKQALTTLLSDHSYGELNAQFIAQVLGLVGESGEFADKVKKLIRDKNGRLNEADRNELLKELGDVLWYVGVVAHLLDASLDEVAQQNLDKLKSRKQRSVIKGAGDNR